LRQQRLSRGDGQRRTRWARDGAAGGHRRVASRYLADMMKPQRRDHRSTDVGHGAQLGDAIARSAVTLRSASSGEAWPPLAISLNRRSSCWGGRPAALSGEILLASVREAGSTGSLTRSPPGCCVSRARNWGRGGSDPAPPQVVLDENLFASAASAWVTVGSPRLQPSFLPNSLEALRSAAAEGKLRLGEPAVGRRRHVAFAWKFAAACADMRFKL